MLFPESYVLSLRACFENQSRNTLAFFAPSTQVTDASAYVLAF